MTEIRSDGGSMRETLAALIFELDPAIRKQIIENHWRRFSRQLAETSARCNAMLRRGSE